MNTQTLNIALPRELVKAIDSAAKREYRNRSEFIREAVLRYLNDKEAWESIYAGGENVAKRLNIKSEAQIDRMIADYRRGK